MTTMIEKMARAAYEHRMGGFADLESPYELWKERLVLYGDELAYDIYLKDMRAALAALLEPSEAMVDAGYDALVNAHCDPHGWSDDESFEADSPHRAGGGRKAYAAMIQAALDEKEG